MLGCCPSYPSGDTIPSGTMWQSSTQLRPAPNRDHAGARTPSRSRLPRAQTSGREKPPRSTPLPQTTTRPRRLRHAQKRVSIDRGATLAHATVLARCAAALAADAAAHPPKLRPFSPRQLVQACWTPNLPCPSALRISPYRHRTPPHSGARPRIGGTPSRDRRAGFPRPGSRTAPLPSQRMCVLSSAGNARSPTAADAVPGPR